MSGCIDRFGDEQINLFACDPEGEFDLQICCARGDACASNGLCVTTDPDALTPYFINGCLVEDWDDPSCPTQCYNSTGNGITSCGSGRYCCYGLGGCDCDDEDVVFTMDPVRIIASIPSDATRGPSSTSTTEATSTTISSTSDTLSSTTQASSIISSLTTSMPESSEALPGQTGEPAATSDGSSSSSNSLPIGLGVGLGVGIPLLIIAIALVWYLRKRRAQVGSTPIPQEPPYGSSLSKPTAETSVEPVYPLDPATYGHYAPPKPQEQPSELQWQPIRSELPS